MTSHRQGTFTHMKLHALAIATALLATALPAPATAQGRAQGQGDDDMSYPRVIHCAALNIVLGQVLGMGEDRAEAAVKAQSETYIAQAAALTLLAAAMSERDPKAVQAEVFAQSETLTRSLEDEAAAEALLQRDFAACTQMGEAAYEAVQQAGKN